MKNLFGSIFKKESGLNEINAQFQPKYINAPSFLNAADDSEHEFENTGITSPLSQDEMQIDNIYNSLQFRNIRKTIDMIYCAAETDAA